MRRKRRKAKGRRVFKAGGAPMKCYNEQLSGVCRVGVDPGWMKPFDLGIAWASVDGHTAVLKALTTRPDRPVTMADKRACDRTLKGLGLKADWTHFKLETQNHDNLDD